VPSYREDGRIIRQSLAIIEYLDECHPGPPLLPATPLACAGVRRLALSIACEIHPLNNPRVLKYLDRELRADEATRLGWMRHWMTVGLQALEALLADMGSSRRFCRGDQPTLAHCCLVPQVFNARRFEVDLPECPRLLEIDATCNALQAFHGTTSKTLYERKSLLITANQPFSGWDEVSPDPGMTVAAIDRLVQHSTIFPYL
jgi:maleylacetoacetate isomerase